MVLLTGHNLYQVHGVHYNMKLASEAKAEDGPKIVSHAGESFMQVGAKKREVAYNW